MKGKLLGSLAALPLIAAGLVGGMDSASAATLTAGEQLQFTGNVLVTNTGFDFKDHLDSDAAEQDFQITGASTSSFFAPNIGSFGVVQDLLIADGETITTTIADFLKCEASSCTNPFSFDLTSATRGSNILAGVKYDNLSVQGAFKDGTGQLIGKGGFSTQFQNGTIAQPFSATITAVPEPTTTAGLLAAGALGAFKAGRRNKKKQEEEVTA